MPDTNSLLSKMKNVAMLFLFFTEAGLSTFGGGVGPRLQKAFVEDRHWLSEGEFSAALALARIMPGASIVNLGALIGHRRMGAVGALASVLGLLVGPGLLVIAFSSLAREVRGAVLDVALQGAAASAAGLLLGMGLKTSGRIFRSLARHGASGVVAGLVLVSTFVLVGLLKFPTVAVVLSVAPCNVAFALASRRSETARGSRR